jgi:N-formylglutamate amidohydrolase
VIAFGVDSQPLEREGAAVANFIIIETPRPLLLSFPHVGTALPGGVEEKLTASGRARHDTDWHLERLYDFAWELGVGQLRAVWSRYLIDLNRAPDDRELYPGMVSTGLV